MQQRIKKWAFFALRWGVAVAGVWWVVSHISWNDRAWAILNPTNVPRAVKLAAPAKESAETFSVVDPDTGVVHEVLRDQVVNEPDKVGLRVTTPDGPRTLLGLDLTEDLHTPLRFLVADPSTGHGEWVAARDVHDYVLKVPHPRVEVGLHTLVSHADHRLLLLALLVMPINFLITAYRWDELLKVLNINLRYSKAFVLNMVGSFYNTFLPGSTGGDVVKALYASRQTPHRTHAVMSVLVDRVIGLLALIILGGVMAAFQWRVPACRKVSLASAGIMTCVAFGMLVYYTPALRKAAGLDFILKRMPMQGLVHKVVDALDAYGRRPLMCLWTLIVSFPVHMITTTSAMFAGMAFGLPLHPFYYWMAVPVIVLSSAIPISPQGAGVMEAFAIVLTRSQGCTVSQAVALTMSIRVVAILWNLTGGIFVLRGGFHAPTDAERHELDVEEGPLAPPAVTEV